MKRVGDRFQALIKHQYQAKALAHAYLVFGDFQAENMREFLKINSPDFLQILENPVKIQSIRQLNHWFSLRPHSSKQRLAVIEHAENLTLEAANALLKTLEEPPEGAILVLRATKKEKILPTILSRCQLVRQKFLTEEVLPQNYISVKKIARMSLVERFQYGNSLIEDEGELIKLLNQWERDLRENLLSGEDTREILRAILRSRSLLSTNTSVKLLLENLLLKF
ncbi:MAG TPA: hypothetical protein VJK26_00840 [Patescibacteria group bacterium]|nr:hypothetical protein [Patescibacteria group bacterium]